MCRIRAQRCLQIQPLGVGRGRGHELISRDQGRHVGGTAAILDYASLGPKMMQASPIGRGSRIVERQVSQVNLVGVLSTAESANMCRGYSTRCRLRL
ncbi:hypothetical protein NDU88_003493 [Pleurodeles waltl]|uniref:Uncharacterized protein n=1 Tax=Pleurodeles waltl TaxID=8319 RepID=A0AAV7QD57_PLEWA|nr:hypothetical protein NDU88_003493 [Pleurodeles waltl]